MYNSLVLEFLTWLIINFFLKVNLNDEWKKKSLES